MKRCLRLDALERFFQVARDVVHDGQCFVATDERHPLFKSPNGRIDCMVSDGGRAVCFLEFLCYRKTKSQLNTEHNGSPFDALVQKYRTPTLCKHCTEIAVVIVICEPKATESALSDARSAVSCNRRSPDPTILVAEYHSLFDYHLHVVTKSTVTDLGVVQCCCDAKQIQGGKLISNQRLMNAVELAKQ